MRARRRATLAAATDRTARSLRSLERTASTSRVLNLLAIAAQCSGRPDWSERPLFRNRVLNASMILKHRLRPDETY